MRSSRQAIVGEPTIIDTAINLPLSDRRLPATPVRHPPRPRFDDADPLVKHVYASKLNAEELYGSVRDIAEVKFVAAHYHGIFPREECEAACVTAAALGTTPYEGASEVRHLSISIYETRFNEALKEEYFRDALTNIQRIRGLWGKSRYPVDLLRALLDEGSPMGASLLRIGALACSVGIVRVQEEGAEILHHEDHIGRDVPEALEAQQIEEQVSVVIVLSTGTSGGETTIFPVRLGKSQYDAHRRPEPHAYAVDEAALPPVSVTLRGEVGDMFLFDARHIHCVSAPQGGCRFTLSFFIGRCRDGSLVLFS